jgi:hypothetical protein
MENTERKNENNDKEDTALVRESSTEATLEPVKQLKVFVVVSDVRLAHKLPRKHTNKLKPSSSYLSSSERVERSEAKCDASGFKSTISLPTGRKKLRN